MMSQAGLGALFFGDYGFFGEKNLLAGLPVIVDFRPLTRRS
jgi:hypothetical protein